MSKKKRKTIKKQEVKSRVQRKKNKKPDKKKAEKIIDIYKAGDGGKVDMTKLEQKPKKIIGKIIFWVIIVLFILAGAAIAGFYFFNQDFTQITDTENDVNLSIESIDEIASGEQVELELIYENKENVAIREGEITIHYPDGFYFQEANPQPNISDNAWNISNIAAGAGGKIKIKGQLVGELEEEKEFTSFITYQPINFNSSFQDTANKKIMINDSIVKLNTDIEELAFSGQEVEYKIRFKNTSSLPLPNVKTSIDFPTDFTLNTTEPAADLNNNIWKFSELDSNEEKIIKIKGTLSGESNEEKEFKFKLGLEEPDGSFNLQVEKIDLVLMVNPNLNLTLEAPEYFSPGDEIEYKIIAENISDIAISNLQLKLKLSEDITEKKVVNLDEIELLKAGDKKEIIETIQTKKKTNKTELEAVLIVEKAKIEEQKFSFEQSAEALSGIKGNLEFSAVARYYADDLTKLGSGPVPPQVGETTNYVIWWQIEAMAGDLKDISMITSLPNYVDGVDATKDIEYDSKNGRVTWQIDELKRGESKKGSFTLFVTPTKDQLNKLLILTKETVVTATDVNTKENISDSLDKITSDLEDDPAASGKGVVEK